MRLLTFSNIEWFFLSYEEERMLAASVMDQLTKVHIQGDFRNFLNRIYRNKTINGSNITAEDMHKLLWWYDQFEIDYPDIPQNEDVIEAPKELNGKKLSKEWRIQWVTDIIKNTWKDVWDIHPIKELESYKFFGDKINQDEYKRDQEIIEEQFWKEVDRILLENDDMDKNGVIQYVSDYMPRGNLGED